MKVKIELTLDIDAEAWMTEYGLSTAYEVRADVQAYIKNTVTEHLRDQMLLTKGA